MNVHEYQAKQILAKYNLPIPRGGVAFTIDEAVAIVEQMQCPGYVVKAQVHAGGRGKAGGVKLVGNKDELRAAVKSMLGIRLVTYQTDANGQPVHSVLVEEVSSIAQELYLGAVVDRSSRRVVIMASTEGGVDI